MVAVCCDMLLVVTRCPSHPIISTTESLLIISEVVICVLLTTTYYKLTRAKWSSSISVPLRYLHMWSNRMSVESEDSLVARVPLQLHPSSHHSHLHFSKYLRCSTYPPIRATLSLPHHQRHQPHGTVAI
jgi:hypothetical protein